MKNSGEDKNMQIYAMKRYSIYICTAAANIMGVNRVKKYSNRECGEEVFDM